MYTEQAELLTFFIRSRSRQIGRTISHQSQDSDLDSVTTEDDNQTIDGMFNFNSVFKIAVSFSIACSSPMNRLDTK